MKSLPIALTIGISGLVIGLLLSPVRAVTNNQDFPDPSTFDRSAGITIDTDINDVSFINTIPSSDGARDEIVAIGSDGRGGIITQQERGYRTYRGLEFTKVPQAQLTADINNDNLNDLVTLLPAERVDSKEWQYARITEVGSDYIITDVLLRKNILSQSTIIAANGNQYQVASNTGPTDSSPRNAIYLSRQLAPSANDDVGDLRRTFSLNEYVTYLLPTKAISKNPQLIVDKNAGDYAFARSSCIPYIPRNIETITAMGMGNANNDNQADLFVITHTTETWHAANSRVQYDDTNHIATMLIDVLASDIRDRIITGSYIAFSANPDRLFPIRQVTANQIAIDIPLPETGVGLSQVQAALLAGDRIWVTVNTEETKKSLVYLGNGKECFTYTGVYEGNVFESSYGQITLPSADSPAEGSRSVITDINANYLPIDSLKGRQVQIGSETYTIDSNNRSQLFLATEAGDIRNQVPDALHQRQRTHYQIIATSPEPTVRNEEITISTIRTIPNPIIQLTGNFSLTNQQPILAADTDGDNQKELLYLNAQHIFLKKQ